jgi:hypothetical protein
MQTTSQKSKDSLLCQGTCVGLVSCSHALLVPTRFHKLSWWLSQKGIRATGNTVLSRIGARARLGRHGPQDESPKTTRDRPGEILNLQPGELVEVRSEREILETLDENGKCRGLLWMDNMASFCTRRYRVYKRVEKVMLESTGKVRKLRNTVLLDGVMCQDLYGCDRSCFHFWREAWLRRVPE